MKRFSKFLMMFALAGFAACTNDTTEDLTHEVGSGDAVEVHTLAVSLPQAVRTQLGDKTAEGKYPVYWSEGDRLAVNGASSGAAKITDNASVAHFEFAATTELPYNIVYPYVEGVVASATEGFSPVVFAAEQHYTEGTFDPGSAPMYGYAEGFNDVQLEHLVGVLRFEIAAAEGEEVLLKHVTLSTTDGTKFVGEYDINCSTGELKVRDSASPTLIYSFDEPFALSTTPSVFYIAVPKGEYDGFTADFVSETGDVMNVKLKRDDNGHYVVAAGEVVEFPTLTYKANGEYFLIGTPADMFTFAEQVKNGTFTKEGAMLVADINLSGLEWEPIEGYTKLFEGRNFRIWDLEKPLFNTINGTVRNLEVHARIVETEHGTVGILAREVVDGALVERCSTFGTLEFKCDTADEINVAGMVGKLSGGSILNSENCADICISSYAASLSINPSIGGVVAMVAPSADPENYTTTIAGLSNRGRIIHNSSVVSNVQHSIGGVVGFVSSLHLDKATVSAESKTGVATLSNLTNSGQIDIYTSLSATPVGGVLGRAEQNICGENLENKEGGNINFRSGASINYVYAGGVIGTVVFGHWSNIINRASFTMEEGMSVPARNYMGGVIGWLNSETVPATSEAVAEKLYNYGEVKILGDCYVDTGTGGTGRAMYGGVVGYNRGYSIDTAENHAKITISGKHGSGAHTSWINSNGGVIGLVRKDSSPVNLSNLTLGETGCLYIANGFSPRGNQTPRFGGVVANMYNALSSADNLCNKGRVEVAAEMGTMTVANADGEFLKFQAFLGGVFGNVRQSISNCRNEGEVIFSGRSGSNTFIGGVTAQTVKNITLDKCENSGTLKMTGYSLGSILIGGIVADAYGISFTANDAKNMGNIIFDGEAISKLYIGGFCSRHESAAYNVSNFVSGGTIEVKKSVVADVMIGGYIGNVTQKVSNHSGIITDTDIKIDASVTGGALYVGGVYGKLAASTTTLRTVNSGDITVTASCAANEINVGGVFGYADAQNSYGTDYETDVLRECINEGKISYAGSSRADAFVGGVMGSGNQTPLCDCVNEGDIVSTGTADGVKSGDAVADTAMGLTVGGIAGNAPRDLVGCVNKGNIQFTAAGVGYRFGVGGIAGTAQHGDSNDHVKYTSTVNHGNITVYGSPAFISTADPAALQNNNRVDSKLVNRLNIAGLVGRYWTTKVSESTALTVEGCANRGSITLPAAGATKCLSIGGLFGEVAVAKCEIKNSENIGNILVQGVTSKGYLLHMAGIMARVWRSEKMTYTIDNCINKGHIRLEEEDSMHYPRAAGIVANVMSTLTDDKALDITIKNCQNYGDISRYTKASGKSSESMAGGILALTGSKPNNYNETHHYVHATVERCVNNGLIQFDPSNGSMSYETSVYGVCVGGIMGMAYGGNQFLTKIVSCENYGFVRSFSGFVGGIAGFLRRKAVVTGTESAPTVNYGDVVVLRDDQGKVQLSNVYATKQIYAGGIAGYAGVRGGFLDIDAADAGVTEADNKENVYIEHAVNRGAVGGTAYAGGIAGRHSSFIVSISGMDAAVRNCSNEGEVYGLEHNTNVGAIVGSTRAIEAIFNGVKDNYLSLVMNCNVAGAVLRGDETIAIQLGEGNYFNYIYGDDWDKDVETSPAYDGNYFKASAE